MQRFMDLSEDEMFPSGQNSQAYEQYRDTVTSDI